MHGLSHSLSLSLPTKQSGSGGTKGLTDGWADMDRQMDIGADRQMNEHNLFYKLHHMTIKHFGFQEI